MERRLRPRKLRRTLQEEEDTNCDEFYIKRYAHTAHTAHWPPLTRTVKKLAVRRAAYVNPSPQPETLVDGYPSDPSTIILVKQILCKKSPTPLATNLCREGLTPPTPVQTEIPIAFGSIPACNASTEELTPGPKDLILNYQIPVGTITPASNASSERHPLETPVFNDQMPLLTMSRALHPSMEELSSDSPVQVHVDKVFAIKNYKKQIPEAIVDLTCDTPTEILEPQDEPHSPACENSPTKPAASFNTTQIVAMRNHHESPNSDHDVESESVLHDGTCVSIGLYKVKMKYARVVDAIFSKHGDITERSSLSVETRSRLLKTVCKTYLSLESSRFQDLTSTKVKSMIKELEDLKILHFKVGWLQARLKEISEALELSDGAYALSQERARNEHEFEQSQIWFEKCSKELERKKKEFEICLEMCKNAKNKLESIEAEKDWIEGKLLVSKAKCRQFHDKSLVQDLV